MEIKIPNGSHIKTVLLDDHGSTEEVETNYYGGGNMSTPVRHRFRVRIQVKNQKEEHEAYMAFSDSLKIDPTMLEPSFQIEHSKKGKEQGYYYAIKCYTKLEY